MIRNTKTNLMERREFIKAGALSAAVLATPAGQHNPVVPKATEMNLPPLPFEEVKSKLKITEVKMVRPKRKKPWPEYKPSEGSWSTGRVEVANPMSIYPEYKAYRALFMADNLGPSTVQIITDKGVSGIGYGGPGAGFVIENHLTKLRFS